jgi:hypothetical protein
MAREMNREGATTFSIMTFSIIDLVVTLSIETFSVMDLIETLSIMTLGMRIERHYA